ncbi:hypothetical protein PMAYCL1PPCAC_08234, partial [Pristionchus mayeri]
IPGACPTVTAACPCLQLDRFPLSVCPKDLGTWSDRAVPIGVYSKSFPCPQNRSRHSLRLASLH